MIRERERGRERRGFGGDVMKIIEGKERVQNKTNKKVKKKKKKKKEGKKCWKIKKN